MPWSGADFPNAMKNLDRKTRSKAIDIANAVLRDSGDEGKAIRIGIAQAKKLKDKLKTVRRSKT
jgi:uncharacterized protein YdaT